MPLPPKVVRLRKSNTHGLSDCLTKNCMTCERSTAYHVSGQENAVSPVQPNVLGVETVNVSVGGRALVVAVPLHPIKLAFGDHPKVVIEEYH